MTVARTAARADGEQVPTTTARRGRRDGRAASQSSLLVLQVRSRFVRQLQRVRMLATIVELLRLVELGDRRLDLGVVGLHLGGRFPCLLDDLRARAGERAASTKGQRHCYRSNGHDLSQDLSPPLWPGWPRSL